MVEILVVDDEALFRKALIASFEWEKEEMHICGEARNGEEALELIKKLKPDIALVDINMPVLNGLDFIKKIRENNDATKIFIISGYDDFVYAQKAIQLGVRGYFLKPVDDDELWKALLLVKEEIIFEKMKQKEKSVDNEEVLKNESLENRAVCEIVHGNWQSPSVNFWFNREERNHILVCCIGVSIENSYWKDEEISILHFAVKNMIEEKMQEYGNVFFGEEKQDLICILEVTENFLPDDDFLDRWRQVRFYAEKFLHVKLAIGVGEIVKERSEVEKSYKSALKSSKSYMAYEEPQMIGMNAEKKKGISGEIITIAEQLHFMEELRLANEMEVKLSIDEIYQRFSKKNDYELLYQALINIQLFLMQVAAEYQIDIWQLNELLLEEEDLKNSMKNGIEKLKTASVFLCEEIKNRRNDGKNIQLVKQYIMEHYMDSALSVKSIAQAVFLNENYLSSHFKKKCGISLSEYIMQFRMEKAKELLKNSVYEIQDVALKTGYLDTNYFSKCFKKAYGKTPKQYRLERN